MTPTLAYYTPDIDRWRGTHSPDELSWEQRELNAGARLIYAARRRRASGYLSGSPRPRPGGTRPALPGFFAPPPLALLPPPPGPGMLRA